MISLAIMASFAAYGYCLSIERVQERLATSEPGWEADVSIIDLNRAPLRFKPGETTPRTQNGYYMTVPISEQGREQAIVQADVLSGVTHPNMTFSGEDGPGNGANEGDTAFAASPNGRYVAVYASVPESMGGLDAQYFGIYDAASGLAARLGNNHFGEGSWPAGYSNTLSGRNGVPTWLQDDVVCFTVNFELAGGQSGYRLGCWD